MPRPVEAITFDLWDTIVIDDSDEPKRAAQNLRPKSEARPFCIYEALSRRTDLPLENVRLAYNTANAAFNIAWKKQHVTWTVPQRLDIIFKGLDVTLPKEDLAALIETLEYMEVVIRPDPIPGVHETLKTLSGKYPLAIISDAIFSPGRALRQLLKGEGLLGYFSATVFSDETGFSKPDPRVFRNAAEQLNVKLENIVHIGDRDHNDVKGPQSLGARAVLFTAARDKDKQNTTADAICERYEDLEAIITNLDQR